MRCDLAVVGAGIVGLAVARELALRHPGLHVLVLEGEGEPARHQTGHNSGVIHAGIPYAPGSLKARLCVDGARDLYAYCEQRAVPHERCGKVIVAAGPAELPRLDELERRGRANGVPGLRRVDVDGIRELEPHARGLAGLHSPASGIADFGRVATALLDDLRAAGGGLRTGCAVTAVTTGARSIRLRHAGGEVEAGHAVFCAGAWSDRLAVAAGAGPDPRILPFRGAYLRLVPARRHQVRALVYPVPDPSLPFLGVHLTRHVDGEVTIGPTALLAGARDAYSLRRVRPRDVADTLAWPGTWRMGRRWWRTGLRELRRAAGHGTLVREAARLVPDLRTADTAAAFAGVRAQAVDRAGRLVDDFVFAATPRALHVRNAPSPAATACLAIARHVADAAGEAFELG
jgi:2-hydroxyglutarate dehydrogenase